MRALIFDYDGLIVDTETCAARIVVELLAEQGVEVSLNSITPFVGTGGTEGRLAWEKWIRDLLGPKGDFADFEDRVTDRVGPLLRELPLLPGVSELINEARHSGWRIGIATLHPRDALERSLRRLGIHDQFDAIVTSDEGLQAKPAPDIYVEAARRLQVLPENCVALEDSVAGSQAALAAGMTVVACPCLTTQSSEFPATVFRVDSLLDLDLTRILPATGA